MGMYTLIQPKMDSVAVYTHKVLFGGGLKAPSKYNVANNGTLNPSFQLGIAGEVYESNKQVKQDVIGTKDDILFSKLRLEVGRENSL